MRKLPSGAAAAAVAMVGAVAATTPAQAAGASVHGCPSGAVCIYPQNAGWNGNKPSVEYWSYGVHNLSGQIGNHVVLNNQYPDGTGWAMVALFTGYNATGTCKYEYSPYDEQPQEGASWATVNLTPINSISMWVVGP